VIQFLIEHNHSWQSIQGYTLAQVGLFSREAGKNAEIQRKELIIASWLGANSDKKGIEQVLRDTQRPTSSTQDVKSDWKKLAGRMGSLR
jgi:hypothetical protein